MRRVEGNDSRAVPHRNRGSQEPCSYPSAVRLLQASLAGLFFSALLVFPPLVHAGDPREKSAAARQDVDSGPHAGIGDFAALRQYAREAGIEPSSPPESGNRRHPHFDTTEATALRDYARDAGIKALPAEAAGAGWGHPGLDGVQAATASDAMGSGQLDLRSPSRTAEADPHANSPEIAALRDYARAIGIEGASTAAGGGSGWAHPRLDAGVIAAAGQTGPQSPSPTDARSFSFDDPELAVLHDHVRQAAARKGCPRPRFRLQKRTMRSMHFVKCSGGTGSRPRRRALLPRPIRRGQSRRPRHRTLHSPMHESSGRRLASTAMRSRPMHSARP